MKTLKQIGILLAVSIIFAVQLNSCKKDKETETSSGDIKVTVYEYGSNAPIKNAAVGLLKRTPGSMLGSASYSVVKTANTDANGMVNFGNYSDWSQLYMDVQHPDYYDMSTLSTQQLAKEGYKVTLSGVSFVSVRFLNVHNRDKPETVLAYYFDPYRGGGGLPLEVTSNDTIYHTYFIPAWHQTNTRYLLFENWDKRYVGQYYKDTLIPFTTAPTNDTIYLTIHF
jgi:hypothetical protein